MNKASNYVCIQCGDAIYAYGLTAPWFHAPGTGYHDHRPHPVLRSEYEAKPVIEAAAKLSQP